MINQWKKVDKLKCPIPTMPASVFNATTKSSASFTAQDSFGQVIESPAFNSSLSLTSVTMVKEKTIHCFENGAEILEDLMIKPVGRAIYSQ